ncbi:MAG: hypothetical protein ACR2NM_16890 [Bythopirellula sp.]
MVGRTIEAKSPLPKGAVFGFVLAIVLGVAGAVTGNVHFLMAAILPLMTSIASWVRRHKDVVITLEENGIVLFGTHHVLPYAEIQAVLVGMKPVESGTTPAGSGPITIAHDHGRFFLPEKTNVSVAELASFLASRIPQKVRKNVHASLVDYTNEQVSKFGEDKVIQIHQREFAHQAISQSAISLFGAAFFLSGALWCVLAVVLEANDNTDESIVAWFGLGFVGVFVGGLMWLFAKAKSKTPTADTKKYGPACIVITPTGLGLAQGEMQGKLRWDEISQIKNGPAKSFGDRDGGLHILFVGGAIVLLDIYDHSLVDIASLIRKNLRLT